MVNNKQVNDHDSIQDQRIPEKIEMTYEVIATTEIVEIIVTDEAIIVRVIANIKNNRNGISKTKIIT